MKAIMTAYEHDGRRYRAWDEDRNTEWVNHVDANVLEDGVPRGHRQAALALIRRMGWGPCGIQSGHFGHNQYVHLMHPTREKPFPRFFRHVKRPTSDTVFLRFDSAEKFVVVTRSGDTRDPILHWDWQSMMTVVDAGIAFEITEHDAGAMLAEVAAGGNPWREP